jgi:TM2 domain-containing membrane protein YozV
MRTLPKPCLQVLAKANKGGDKGVSMSEVAETEKRNINGNTLFYLSLFLGWFGVDRFYARKAGTGILKLITLGWGGVWWLIDLILILGDRFKDASGKIVKVQGNKVLKAIQIFPAFLLPIALLFTFASLLEDTPEEKAAIKARMAQIDAEREAKDSLQSEESYAQAKQLFDDGKFDEALLVLKKISSKHEKYGEAQDMVAFADEYAKVATAIQVLSNLVYSKDDFSASSKEFQSMLKNAVDTNKVKILVTVVITFGVMAENIELCEKFQISEMKYLKPQERNNLKAGLKKLTAQAKDKLQKEQRRNFPALRKEYAKIISEKFWRDNIEIEARGNGNTRLEIINGMFANNANKEDFQKSMNAAGVVNVLKLLRFKSTAYKWYKHDDEYTYYQYDTPADDAEVNKNTLPDELK